MTDDRVKQLLQDRADAALGQAVEKKIYLQDMRGTLGAGYYFTATDRAPKTGEYKYMTQGMLRTGALVLTFTVLTNDGQQGVVEEALKMLRQAAHIGST